METRDCNGALLADGDNVTLIKDLKVKGNSTTLQRGIMVKNVRLTGDPDEVIARPAATRAWCSAPSSSKKA